MYINVVHPELAHITERECLKAIRAKQADLLSNSNWTSSEEESFSYCESSEAEEEEVD